MQSERKTVRPEKTEKTEWPKEVKSGSVLVKIYKVQTKGRTSFTVSHFASGKRSLKMVVDYKDAHVHVKSVGTFLANGELDVLELRSGEPPAGAHY